MIACLWAAASCWDVAGAALFGLFCVRLSGVYFAMLTLAFAQIVWSIAFQWSDLTGGDNGLLGIWPEPLGGESARLLLAGARRRARGGRRLADRGVLAVRLWPARHPRLDPARRGARHRAAFARNGPPSWSRRRHRRAGRRRCSPFSRAASFPTILGISTSVDGLVMVLLGGIGSVSASVAGAVVYKALSVWLISQTDYSKLVLGVAIVALVRRCCRKGLVGLTRSPAAPTRRALRRPRRRLRPGWRARNEGRHPRAPPCLCSTVASLKQGLWRRAGRARRVFRAGPWRDAGHDRAERGGQVDLLQHAQWPDPAGYGGTVRLDGRDVTGASPRAACGRRGVGRTFQITATFHSMSGARERRDRPARPRPAASDGMIGRAREAFAVGGCDAVLDLVDLGAEAGPVRRARLWRPQAAGTRHCARQRSPTLLLMDEPTAGMAPKGAHRADARSPRDYRARAGHRRALHRARHGHRLRPCRPRARPRAAASIIAAWATRRPRCAHDPQRCARAISATDSLFNAAPASE